jgi:hypothetical protein
MKLEAFREAYIALQDRMGSLQEELLPKAKLPRPLVHETGEGFGQQPQESEFS